MSGVGFWEFFFLCMIGLVVLGPKRLPQVANQLGTWVGQARRMTRVMRRQLEEELDFDKELNIKPTIHSSTHAPPRDDDSYSPLHKQPEPASADIGLASSDSAASPAADVDDAPENPGDDSMDETLEVESDTRRDA